MAYGELGVGDCLLNPRGAGGDGLDVVVQVEHLTAAPHLTADRLIDHGVVVLQHIGLHRLTVHRRFLDDAHVAQSAHSHVEGARYRSRGEREHIDIPDELLEALLLRDAEALFLVDYRESEVAEYHVLLDEAVCADHHIQLAAPQTFDDLLLLLGGAEAREQLDAHGIALKALCDGLVVLPRENGGRAEQSALLGIRDALERRPQRDLGLAEADVAAEQAVHRDAALHVALDLVDAGDLVGRFLVLERRLKVALPLVVA